MPVSCRCSSSAGSSSSGADGAPAAGSRCDGNGPDHPVGRVVFADVWINAGDVKTMKIRLAAADITRIEGRPAGRPRVVGHRMVEGRDVAPVDGLAPPDCDIFWAEAGYPHLDMRHAG